MTEDEDRFPKRYLSHTCIFELKILSVEGSRNVPKHIYLGKCPLFWSRAELFEYTSVITYMKGPSISKIPIGLTESGNGVKSHEDTSYCTYSIVTAASIG